MRMELVRKILIEAKGRRDLAELLEYSYESINQTNTYGSRAFSFVSTYEIYSPLKQHLCLKKLSQDEQNIILAAVQIAIPPRDNDIEIVAIEFFLDDSINIKKTELLETQEISEVTKRDIIDEIQLEDINIYGRLDEIDFLKRIYNLSKLPSTDGRYQTAEGDIFQHTINNSDWSVDWVFGDSRFKIINGSDQDFLRFICEMVHPAVRSDSSEVDKLLQLFNKYLANDGWELKVEKYISGKPAYVGSKITIHNAVSSDAIKFKVVTQKTSDISEKNIFVLKQDNWDDFCFKTTFCLHYFDELGKRIQLGYLKIIKRGMWSGRVEIPNEFSHLSEEYCSLGIDQNYYETLMTLPENLKEVALKALQDCVYNQSIFDKFQNEKGMKASLLREVTTRNVRESFKNILDKNSKLTPYKFTYSLENKNVHFDIEVIPESLPPSNIHALIGRNGVGKTRILSGIADSLLDNESSGSKSLKGQIDFYDEEFSDSGRFAGLITIVFSTFDAFEPISQNEQKKKGINYNYIGLKKIKDKNTTSDFKNINDLNKEFKASLTECITSVKKERWLQAISILNNDPCFNELDLYELGEENSIDSIFEQYKILSSGHKIVLFSITKLVQLVNDRTLVLIDEPENHLHPPLLASFIRALSNLLTRRNGVAILATHSPVVLQEIPKSCVSIINRYGEEYTISRPAIETFGENVGTLTREAFTLEVEKSGFHQILFDSIKNNTFEEIKKSFNNQIGIALLKD